ncbi:MAG: hypothetical protein JSV42_11525 [Chloroflexota bacterium]|nr:MAG: hypothetical protein JSV42_11525 [Chloroflexota bacterium]
MTRISLWTLLFAVLFVVFFILLILFRIPFPPYPLMSYQDAFDLLTPFVLIPLYWYLFKQSGEKPPSQRQAIAFMLLVVFWVQGQGMHLAANSINNLIGAKFPDELASGAVSEISQLTYFYDEYLSHYLWHIGVLGLAALLIYREWRQPAGLQTTWWAAILGGVIYGFTLFIITNEGQTVPIGFPFAALVTVFGLFWGPKKFGTQPLLAFFFIACLVAFLCYIGWGLYWGAFPEFGEVGFL